MARRTFSTSDRRFAASTSSAQNPMMLHRKSMSKKGKSTTASSIGSLLDFLGSTCYNEPVSMRTLQSPSSKVFFSIFEHTMHLSYPSFTLPEAKSDMEDCFLNTLRSMGYKTVLSKSKLSTPGAFHAWPSLLAALEWLRNELAEADVVVESDEVYRTDTDTLDSQPALAKIRLDMNLACMHDFLFRSLNPSDSILEDFRQKVFAAFGVSQEQVKGMEMELEKLQNEPTAESLAAKQHQLQLAIQEMTKETTVAADEYEHIKAQLSGAEAAAKRASGIVETLRKERNGLLDSINQLEANVDSQQAKYGNQVQTHQVHVERCRQRLKVKQNLQEENQTKAVELGRLDGIVPQALDKYNKFVMSGRKNPLSVDLVFRNYVGNFDPLKEIPMICAELKNARKQLEVLEADSRKRESDLIFDLTDAKNDLQRKTESAESLKKRLAETQSLTSAREEEQAKKALESSRWLAETELAISELSLANEAREAKFKALRSEYQEYQDGYKYYLDLNRKSKEMRERVTAEMNEFVEVVKLAHEARMRKRRQRQQAYTKALSEMDGVFGGLESQLTQLISEATDLKVKADALALDCRSLTL